MCKIELSSFWSLVFWITSPRSYFTSDSAEGWLVVDGAIRCESVSDCPSSSSTSWMVGVTSEGGREVFFFFRFFLRFLSALCTLLRKRWAVGRWVDRGWCVWWNACLWSGEGNEQGKEITRVTLGYFRVNVILSDWKCSIHPSIQWD